MTEIKNKIKALEGDESLLLVLPKEVSRELDIADQDWLNYEVKNKKLVIKKNRNKRNIRKNGKMK